MKLWFERGAWASTRGRKALEKISPESVGRIVVIRHAALGDMILTRPFLVEAKKYFPNAEIVLSIVSNYSYGVPHDLVDRVHVIQGSDQPNVSLRARLARARELGVADILFDLADTTRSRYLTWLSDAKIKIGFPYRWYLRNLLFDAAVFRSDFVFEAEAMLDTLKLLGANPKTPIQFNWPQHSQHGAVRSLAKRIVYFPFASVRAKCWPKEYFSQLISVLATELPNHCHVILAGIGKDEGPADFMNLAENYRNVECQPVLNLDLTIQLLGNSNLVISNDTGVRNLAISVDTPTLGIFFSTVPHRYWPRGSGHHKAVFLPDGEIPTVEQVAAEARQLLGKADIWVEKIRC
jgi:ADP-heptose:LPS heptosyltransferase